MLPSIASVLNENKESLLSDLAAVAACTGRGHWVHFGHREKWLTAISVLTLVIMIEAF